MNDHEDAADDVVLRQVRTLVQAELGDREIEQYQWEALVKENYPVPDTDGFGEEAALREAVAATVKAWRNFYGKVRPSTGRTRTKPTELSKLADLRQAALTALYVEDARKDEGLAKFRSEVLKGQLLPGGEQSDEACRNWIQAYDRGWMYYGKLMEHRLVADAPDDDSNIRMPSDLRDLHRLSEELGKRYDWIKGAATQFVLTDNTPKVYPLRAQGRIPYSWISASRITLTVDPAISPEELSEFYQRVRKSSSFYAGQQVRPLTEKSLLLAAFSADTNDDERAVDQVKRWNVLHPEHPYDPADPVSVSNFRRDMKQSRERLLHPRLGVTAKTRQQAPEET